MSRARRRLAPAVLAALAAGTGLAGCISVFPKQVPAQMYRFDALTAAAPPAADDAPRVDVIAPPVTVARASSTDRLLAVTGQETAYIGAARWISPAAVIWDETVRRAFAARASRVRLLTRNELATGRAFLRLDVPEFEVRYPAADAAPTVRVTLHALFTHRNGAFSAEHSFTADAPAAENRVGAIVSAYDVGVEQVVAAAVAWADAHADAAAVEPAPASATPVSIRPAPRAEVVTSTRTTASQVRRARP